MNIGDKVVLKDNGRMPEWVGMTGTLIEAPYGNYYNEPCVKPDEARPDNGELEWFFWPERYLEKVG